jgi:hypothetical protein
LPLNIDNLFDVTHYEFTLLSIKIDTTEFENQHSLTSAFADFVQQSPIKQEISVSIAQLEAGKAIPLQEVMHSLRKKYGSI